MAHKERGAGPTREGQRTAEATERPASPFVPPPVQTEGELRRAVGVAEARLNGLSGEVREIERGVLQTPGGSFVVYNQAGAEAHSRALLQYFKYVAGERMQDRSPVLPQVTNKPGEFDDEKPLVDLNVEAHNAARIAARAEERRDNLRLNGEVYHGMMTIERLGIDVYADVWGVLPVLTTETREFFDMYYGAFGRSAAGSYVPGTNHILMSPVVGIPDTLEGSRADRVKVIAHEQRHYYSRVCRNKREESLGNDFTSPPMWLDEGITELGAQRYARGIGHEPSNVAYQTEVVACTYLEKIVQSKLGETEGARALEHAYLTGDFRKVKSVVDEVLGRGTFRKLLRKENGAEALQFLVGRIRDSGIDRSGWNEDAVLRGTGMDLEGIWQNM